MLANDPQVLTESLGQDETAAIKVDISQHKPTFSTKGPNMSAELDEDTLYKVNIYPKDYYQHAIAATKKGGLPNANYAPGEKVALAAIEGVRRL